MSIQTLIAEEQPEHFAFDKASEKEIKKAISKYPEGRQASAVKSLLYIAQKQNDNWIPVKAELSHQALRQHASPRQPQCADSVP